MTKQADPIPPAEDLPDEDDNENVGLFLDRFPFIQLKHELDAAKKAGL